MSAAIATAFGGGSVWTCGSQTSKVPFPRSTRAASSGAIRMVVFTLPPCARRWHRGLTRHEETRRIRSPAGAPLRQADRQAPERVREPAAIHVVEAGHRLAEHAHAYDAMAGRGDLLGHLPIGADEHLTGAAAAGGEGVGGELGLHRGEEGLAETVLIAALEELERGLDGALRRGERRPIQSGLRRCGGGRRRLL